ncbi:MAG: glycosyltransferase family 1 protein [Desulfuromonadaceae bacterium]|nr:glycosyltransferase family 1 protein [Desulfuromonadaceae bacterium]
MRVGLNAISFAPRRIGGMETYFRNLLAALLGQDTETEYLLLCDGKYAGEFPESGHRLQVRTFDYAPGSLKWFTRGVCRNLAGIDPLAGRIKSLPVDVIHHPFTVLTPPRSGIRSVLTFHDMQHEFYPDFFPAWELRKKRLTYRQSVEEATRIIAISQHVKDCLVERYQADPSVIDVIYQGCSPAYRLIHDNESIVRIRNAYGLDKPYMLYPAATWPHKNHKRLLEAISMIRDDCGFDGLLVLTGIEMQAHTVIKDEINRLGLAKQVKILGYLPTADLPALYNCARLMVFPSLFEGFGIPLVEAMACGCPVVCAGATSLPEVVGSAGMLFDPRDAEGMAETIWSAWSDEGVLAGMRERGLERVRLFDWDDTARKTIAVYKKACGAV